jgi:hypothetical protein
MVLGDGQRLPFGPRQVLHVRDEMVAEHLQHLALKLIALAE